MDFRTVWFIICAFMVLISLIGLYARVKRAESKAKDWEFRYFVLLDEIPELKKEKINQFVDRDAVKKDILFVIDQLKYLQKEVDKCEVLGGYKKQIAELEKEKTWLVGVLNEAKTERNEAQFKIQCAWHAHQIVKKGKQVICLTAIVEASDGPGAVAAFESQMKDVKAKMRIRSKAPVFAKPVFPNI